MEVAARTAQLGDLADLERLYRLLEREMEGLHPMWPLADGLAEPLEASLIERIGEPGVVFIIGLIDGVAVGLAMARIEDLLPQAGGIRIGSIRLVFVEMEAREVGVGEAMLDQALSELRSRGLERFDAHVLPGHRLAKNFFEAGGFAARSIIMHHVDE